MPLFFQAAKKGAWNAPGQVTSRVVNLGSSSFQGPVGTVAVMESRSALVYDVGFWHRPAAPTGKSQRWTRSSGPVLRLRPSFWKKEAPKSHGQHPFGFVVAVFSFSAFFRRVSDMSFQKALV